MTESYKHLINSEKGPIFYVILATKLFLLGLYYVFPPYMPPVQSKKTSVSYLIVAFVALLVIAFLLTRGMKAPHKEETSLPEPTKEKVVVKATNLSLAKTDAEKIPTGFPGTIPVETKNAFESYSITFPERKMTQYSISYISEKTPQEKYKEYLDFMTKAGFAFDKNGKNEAEGQLYGVKKGNDLAVSARTEQGKTAVKITYLEREQ